jgi:Tol biopolymer transport system component
MGRPAALSLLFLGFVAACHGEDDDDVRGAALDAVDDAVTVDEDTPIAVDVLANDSNEGAEPLRLVRASAEGHEVTVEGALVRVATRPNWNGTIDVSYFISNGERSSNGHAVITVTPVNDAPTARAGSATTGRNHAQPIVLEGNDVDMDTLTFVVDSGPSHGTLSGTAPALTYTPAEGYVGNDAIVFHTRDAADSSAAATIAITVTDGTNPVAQAQTVTTLEDTARTITLVATDADNDALTYAITTQPAHGTITGTPPNVTYTPAADYVGADSFVFTANDGILTSDPATVAITVDDVNDTPVANAQTVNAMEDLPSALTLTGTDTEGSTLTFTIVDAPTRGTLTGTGAMRTYQPSANLNGSDSFTFTVSDGLATSAPATVTIEVASVEDAPVALAQSLATSEDAPLAIVLSGTDDDGDALTFTVTSATIHGLLSGTAPNLTYTPYADFHGSESFTFTATDGHTTSAPATIALDIAAVDDAPFVQGMTLTGEEGALIAIPLPTVDRDLEPLTFTISTPPAHGTISGTPPMLTYSTENYNGVDTFAITASDGHTTSAPGVFTVTVTETPDAPIARDDLAIATPGQWLEIDAMANDEDPDDGDFIFIQSVTTPTQGEAQTDGDQILYRVTDASPTPATFTYTVIDASGRTATATVTVGLGEFPAGQPVRVAGNGPQGPARALILPHDVSGDGRYVAFISEASLVADDTNTTNDVYVWDALQLRYERVSVAADGGATDGTSRRPTISANGRYVAFESVSTNLVAGDTNGQMDIFVRDRVAGTTTRVSVSSSGAQATGISTYPSISADGTVIAFHSTAFDLVPNDTNGALDVFVRDLVAGTTTRISEPTGGGEADAGAGGPVVSGDGRVVAFVSSSTNLVADDTNNNPDIFVHDRTSGITERVSVSSTGGQASGASGSPALSYDGRFVAFNTNATDLVPDSSSLGATAVRDRVAHTTTNAYPGGIAYELALSSDGRYLVGQDDDSVVLRDRIAALTQLFTGPRGVYRPRISRNGRYIVAISSETSPATGTQISIYPNPF